MGENDLGAINTDPPDLAVAVEGDGSGFPDLADVALRLRALESTNAAIGRCLDPPSTDELRRALPPVKFPVVRNVFARVRGDSPRGHGFASPSVDERKVAREAAVSSAQRAAELGARWLILELGGIEAGMGAELSNDPFDLTGAGRRADAEPLDFRQRCEEEAESLLDRTCRELHAVASAVPEVVFAILTPRAETLPTPDILTAVLEDLGPRRVQYWHDTGRARALSHRGLVPEDLWLDRFADRCVGVDLSDSIAGLDGLPAGSGEVDFVAVRGALSRQALGVVRAEPDPGPGPLLESIRMLRAVGF